MLQCKRYIRSIGESKAGSISSGKSERSILEAKVEADAECVRNFSLQYLTLELSIDFWWLSH